MQLLTGRILHIGGTEAKKLLEPLVQLLLSVPELDTERTALLDGRGAILGLPVLLGAGDRLSLLGSVIRHTELHNQISNLIVTYPSRGLDV